MAVFALLALIALLPPPAGAQTPEAPDAISSVSVTHNGSSLTVTWDAPARATSYDVTYYNRSHRVNARAAWDHTGTSLTVTCDSRYPDQDRSCVNSGVVYTVSVRAKNAGGASDWTVSAPISLSVPDPVPAIGVVHNGQSLSVTWFQPDGATGYDLTYHNRGNGETGRAAWNYQGNSLTVTCDVRTDPAHNGKYCVKAGAIYTVSIRARNAIGASAWVTSEPKALVITKPTGLTLEGTQVGGRSAVRLSWNSAGHGHVAQWQYRACPPGGRCWAWQTMQNRSGTQTNYTALMNRDFHQTLTFQVRGVDVLGRLSPESDKAAIRGAPESARVVDAGGGKDALRWETVTGAVSYEYRIKPVSASWSAEDHPWTSAGAGASVGDALSHTIDRPSYSEAVFQMRSKFAGGVTGMHTPELVYGSLDAQVPHIVENEIINSDWGRNNPWLGWVWNRIMKQAGFRMSVTEGGNPGYAQAVASTSNSAGREHMVALLVWHPTLRWMETYVFEMGRMFVADERGPGGANEAMGAGWLYFGQLSAKAARDNVPCPGGDYGQFAEALRRSVVDRVFTYRGGCTTVEAVTVARSVGAGEVPAWFIESFQNSDGTWKHEEIWSMTKSNARFNTVFHFSNSFGGYCGSLRKAQFWMQASSTVTNPWRDGGCAPSAPTGTGVVVSAEGLTASWSTPDDAGGAPVGGYVVEWKASGVAGWDTDVTRAEVDADSASYLITSVMPGQEYQVRIIAKNEIGDGDPSAVHTATPTAGVSQAPDAVADVRLIHNGDRLAVAWDPPARATHYDVVYGSNGLHARAAWNRAGTALTITCDIRPGHEGQHCVSAEESYVVAVRARNAAGHSAWRHSNDLPDPVANVSVTHNGDSLTVSWDAAPRATDYDVTYYHHDTAANARGAWGHAGTSLTITCDTRTDPAHNGKYCVHGGTTFTVAVRARNTHGSSGWTNSAPASPAAAGQAEIWFTTPGPGTLDLFVVRPARTVGYEARTKTGGGSDCTAGTWGQAAAAAHNHVAEYAADRITLTGLRGGTAYCVQVRATNANATKGAWSAAATATPGLPLLSVADATVAEPATGTANLDFVVTLAPASPASVTVAYATGGGTATAGTDYTTTSGTLTFAAGETSKTVSVPVLPDAHDDGGETLTLTLSNASGASLSDAEAIGTITNAGPIPQAWTARFGRTVADQVLGAVEGRMQAGREPGAEVSLAGVPLFGAESGDADAAREKEEARREARRLAQWLKGGTGFGEAARGGGDRTVTARELMFGSSFALTAGTADGGSAAFWGRAAVTRFDGREGETSVDGEVTTALLGADWSRGRATAGLMMGHSLGDGGYRGVAGGGTVSSTLTGLYPWGRYALSERVTAWGVAGWGEGTLSLTPEDADGARQATLRADLELAMGAAGLRGTLLDGGGEGLTLTTKTDAMAVRTATGRGRGADGGTLAATAATVTRLRLGLEARRPLALGDPGSGSGAGSGAGSGTGSGAILTPSFEAGVRHDGGDAETGFGLDLGGGLALSDPGLGLEAEVRARGLLTHEAGGFRERGLSGALHWRQRPDSPDRGATLTLTQTVGGASSGGADALLGRTTLQGLAADDGGSDDLRARRLEVRIGYGFSAFSGGFTLTPEAGAGFADSGRDYRLGLRLAPAGETEDFEVSLAANRHEAAADPDGSGAGAAEHALGLRLNARF